MSLEQNWNSVVDLFFSGTREFANPKLLNYKPSRGNWAAISAHEAEQRVKNVALGLYTLGLRPGDRLALIAESSPDWVLLDLGALSIGIVDVPIYTTHTLSNLEIILSNSQPSGLAVATRRLYDRFLPVIEKLNLSVQVISFETTPFASDQVSLAAVEMLGKKADAENPSLFAELNSGIKKSDLATIVYTSGESGEPKGAMLSHENLLSNVLACEEVFHLGPDDAAFSFLPLSHVFERGTLYHYLYSQVSVYFAESIERTAADILEVRPTVLTTVPRFLEKVEERILGRVHRSPTVVKWILRKALRAGYEHDPRKKRTFLSRLRFMLADWFLFGPLRKRFGGRVRHIISGGAWLRPDLARLFTAAGLPVLQGYGLTETSPVISVNTPKDNEIGSVGKVIPGVSVKISDDGEILAKGPNVMQGYYRDSKGTREVFEEGWFKTGDIGFLDHDGFLFVIDRKKDLFKTSGGKYIAPQAIEKLFRKSPYVEMAVVVGEGKKFAAAMIFPNFKKLAQFAKQNQLKWSKISDLVEQPIITALFEGVVNEVNARLANWETIKKFALIGEQALDGQAGANMKMRRRLFEQRYRDIVDSLYP